MKYRLHNKELTRKNKRQQQKYLLLLSNQIVIIGGEWEVMKMWRKYYHDKSIHELLPTTARLNSGVTGLTKLLESLEIDHKK